ncbi:MAG: hypothetical protein IKF71_05260 [Bacilli bacterium]|nr:hypothetical protein [Bacilli bacterium]
MNPYPFYPIQPVIEELKCIREQLMRIENTIEKLNIKSEKNYLEKDDNYYII